MEKCLENEGEVKTFQSKIKVFLPQQASNESNSSECSLGLRKMMPCGNSDMLPRETKMINMSFNKYCLYKIVIKSYVI